MKQTIHITRLRIGRNIIMMNDGTKMKELVLEFVDDTENETIILPIPEEIFAKFATDILFHFKEFKKWIDTGKLPHRKQKDETEKEPEYKYHQ